MIETQNMLDIYLPKKTTSKIPTIINIHGGGWCYGTKETYQFYGLGLAKRGFAFINPNYRLAPEVTFPAELDDVNQYIHWVAEHAAEYNLDPENVFLVGDSAGGQMAEQYVAILKNSVYRQKFGYQLPNLKFRAVALNSAAVFLLDPGMINGAVKGYFTDEVLLKQRDLLNTEKYITTDYLPTFISTATEDFIRDASIKFAGFLTGKGIQHIFKEYGDQEHPRPHVFLINQKDTIADQANDDEIAFFKQFIVK
ncbi:MAG: alpha/beta hydrolase [Liquorilactobacillus nagelii]|jgi:acetyl esterase/lipase|uniref:alpha/beta hydrolase n=1 Tax=Liquorilactobacillus nagelii TaxID=82688 RepID=UPI00242CE912|nr:alpha/beta hydrolase [Liquorilactobacillus nagelii]MCI1922330.1 alpha/beta hydrolase [Liquorilactobacillus nagelii]MCI1977772.1 alpha/beta hydrolase [Liquorilactobacillus nagelii]